MTATLTRTAPGLTMPRAGVWRIDPQRASVAFSGKASLLAPTVRARFDGVTGSVLAADDAGQTEVDVAVAVATISTGNRAWDELLRSVDPFDADTFPTATYRSSALRWSGSQVRIEGVLTLRGIGQAVPLTADYALAPSDDRLTIRATGAVRREDFGIRCDIPGCRLLLPRDLQLSIEVEATYTGTASPDSTT